MASGKAEQVISKREEREVKVFIPLASSLPVFFPRTVQYIRKCQLKTDNAIRLCRTDTRCTRRIKLNKKFAKSESWAFTDNKNNFEFVLFTVTGYGKTKTAI